MITQEAPRPALQTIAEDVLEPAELSLPVARVLLRFVEQAPSVCRRHQFFRLLQDQVQTLLPHTVALCGAYDRCLHELSFDVFNSVVLPPGLMLHGRASSPLLIRLVDAWLEGRGESLAWPLAAGSSDVEVAALREAGINRLLVHGVSRPQRLHEISTLFVLGGSSQAAAQDECRLLRMVMPSMHSTYLRVLEVEREFGNAMPESALQRARLNPSQPRITPRELQILSWVRAGKSNQQIGEELEISPLTVKNHIQKILRKMGASNRAHALAMALQMKLLTDER
jgi:transcriptional regulator EpsA